MANGDFGAIGQGVMQGLHLGMALQNQKWRGQQLQRENRRADERMDMRRQRFDMQQKADRMQIEKLRDEQQTKKQLRLVNSQLLTIERLKDKAAAGEEITPEEWQRVVTGYDAIYQPEINQNLPKGAIDKHVVDFRTYPGANGEVSDGQSVVPMIQTTWEDGRKTVGPLTQNRSNDPNDPVMPIPVSSIIGDLKHRADALKARLVQLGDNTPLETLRKRRETAAETQREIAKENRKFKHDVGLEAVKARFKAQGSGAEGGKPPAMVQSIEWIAQNLTNGDKKAAYTAYQQGKSNPKELLAKIYNDVAKNDTFNELSPEERMQRAGEIFRQIYSNPLVNPLAGGERRQAQRGGLSAADAPESGRQASPPTSGRQAAEPDARTSVGGASKTGPQTRGLSRARGRELANVPPASALQEGVKTTFRNGEVWTLIDGQPIRVR